MYKTKGGGFISATGPLWLVAFATIINLALFVWVIYFLVKIAEHVNAWPF